MIKAIIFDFDGVIAESMDIKADGFAYLFKDYPDKVKKIVEYHMTHGGMPRMEKFSNIYKLFLGKEITEPEKQELSREFTGFVYNKVVSCPYVKGAKEFIEKYSNKYKMFVVSGTPDNEIKAIVEARGLEKYFTEILGSPLKKNELNRNILAKYGLKPEETVFIGDSVDDYDGVKGTGIIFIFRKTKPEDAVPGKPAAVITDLTVLEQILNDTI